MQNYSEEVGMHEESSGRRWDVIVVGGGNAGFSAALAAAERGRSVLLLERGREGEAGGNSFYTAGATRVAHGGLEDLLDILEPDERHAKTLVPPYSREDFRADMVKVTGGANDPALTEVLVSEGLDTVRWLHGHGLRYRLMYERQAYARPDGTYLFWGGLHIGNLGGGQGLVADHTAAANRAGVAIRYAHRAIGLLVEDGRVAGVRVEGRDDVRAESVVLAAGGFEANGELRRRHLGEGWENAKVRGTPLNTGDMILAALEIGAAPGGDWTTCHSVAWDAWADLNESNRELTNRLTRQSYPLGIVVNVEGRRFLDEGADFRNYTYAKYGREILAQPGSIAFQLFDADLRPLLRAEEYDMPGIGFASADTLDELARMTGVDPDGLRRTLDEFNASIDRSVPFDPTVKDGRSAGVQPPKSNWAMPIETAPFYAYPVTCGITFTFGGVKTDIEARVLGAEGVPIPGLFAAGEMLGGLFSQNYPGGSGLTAGMVFGRRAGSRA
ncbi:FAD-dependent tricarballylate dehydrogenase TcuA [Naasia sp.]|uniref:FAD-dependent tricarballylate dehydrogenase TcuA n=1 Tax=Naasia sp. TaxID=2546198 RepID=UPI00261810E8|nr:FAD-dependent tricarballylate dehydrogenase TcuA [Naasia sp.]